MIHHLYPFACFYGINIIVIHGFAIDHWQVEIPQVRCIQDYTENFGFIFSQIIQDFEDGSIELFSYEGEDYDPDSWEIDSLNTYDNTEFSLHFFGNTWKQTSIQILPVMILSGISQL
jgi:hypothetical protein